MTHQIRVCPAEDPHRETIDVFSCSSINKCQFYLPTTNNGSTLLKLIVFLSVLLLLLLMLLLIL